MATIAWRPAEGRIEPLAYAELLAEFYSGRDIEGPGVTGVAVPGLRAGDLVRTFDAFAQRYPWVNPARVGRPRPAGLGGCRGSGTRCG